MRWIALAGLVISALSLLVTLALARRDTRVRETLDAAKIVLAVGSAVAIGALTAVQTPLWLIFVAIGLGLAAGVAIGSTSTIRLRGDEAFMQRAWIGVAIFAIGLLVTQLASLANRYRLVEIGLALTWFSAATTAGVFFGRRPGIEAARRAATQPHPGAPVAGVAMAVGLIALLSGPAALAQTGEQTLWEGPMTPVEGSRTSVTVGDNRVTREFPVTYPGASVTIMRAPGTNDFTIEIEIVVVSAKDYALTSEALSALLAADVIDSFHPNFCVTTNTHRFSGAGSWNPADPQSISFEGESGSVEERDCELEDLDPYEFGPRQDGAWVDVTDAGLQITYRGHEATLPGALVDDVAPEDDAPADEPESAEEQSPAEEGAESTESDPGGDATDDVESEDEDAGAEEEDLATDDASATTELAAEAGTEVTDDGDAADDQDVSDAEAAAVGVTAAAAAAALAAAHAAAQGARWDDFQDILRGRHVDLEPTDETADAGAVRSTDAFDEDRRPSERSQDAIAALPPDVQRQVLEAVEARRRDEAVAEAIERGRQALAGLDPWAPDADAELADSVGALEAFDGLPPEVARDARHTMLDRWEADNLAAREAQARAAIEAAQAQVLLEEAIRSDDPRRVEQILDQLPDEARDAAWDQAATGRNLPPDFFTRPRPPRDELPAPSLLPPWDQLDSIEAPPGVQEAMTGLPLEVGRQVADGLRSGLESELVGAALDEAREALGEVDRSSPDLSSAVRDDERVQRVLESIPVDRRAGVEAQLVERLERERIDREAAAVRDAIEDRQAVALLQGALRSGAADRVDQVLGQLPADRADAVWREATAGEHVDLEAMRAARPPSGLPAPDLLPPPTSDVNAVLLDSPSVDEVVAELPAEVRQQVLDQAQAQLEADLRDAALERARAAARPLDPRTQNVTDAVRRDEGVQRVLDQLPTEMRQEVERDLVSGLEAQRIDDAIEASRHGIELDQAEAAVRQAVATGDRHSAQRILQGLDPADADAIGDAVRRDMGPRPGS